MTASRDTVLRNIIRSIDHNLNDLYAHYSHNVWVALEYTKLKNNRRRVSNQLICEFVK